MQLVYLAPLSWHSFTQRPHQFVDWFHTRFGASVLWVEPYPTRFPKINDLQRLKAAPDKVDRPVPEWLRVIQLKCLPIEPVPGSHFINTLCWRAAIKEVMEFSQKEASVLVIGKPSKFALQLLQKNWVKSLYDIMDDFPEFYTGFSKVVLQQTEQKIVSKIDAISVSSENLRVKWAHAHNFILVAKNGVDLSLFSPKSPCEFSSQKKIIGYLGTVGEWFDWNLLIRIALENSECEVRVVGPVYKQPPLSLPENVVLKPACAHEQAAEELHEFSMGVIPFLENKLTHGVDPIKFYEYHAVGLPVITTLFGEMASHIHRPGVFIFDQNNSTADPVVRALNYCPNLDDLVVFRHVNSWKERFSVFESLFSV